MVCRGGMIACCFSHWNFSSCRVFNRNKIFYRWSSHKSDATCNILCSLKPDTETCNNVNNAMANHDRQTPGAMENVRGLLINPRYRPLSAWRPPRTVASHVENFHPHYRQPVHTFVRSYRETPEHAPCHLRTPSTAAPNATMSSTDAVNRRQRRHSPPRPPLKVELWSKCFLPSRKQSMIYAMFT